jgi:hypothetical protein
VACADTTQPEELIVVYNGLSILKTLQQLGLEVDETHEILQEHLPTLGTFLLDLMTKESKAKPAKGRRVYQTLLSDLVLHIPDTTLLSSDAFHDVSHTQKSIGIVFKHFFYIVGCPHCITKRDSSKTCLCFVTKICRKYCSGFVCSS